MEVEISCEFCGGKMYLIERDRVRSKVVFRCERCRKELVIDWIRIARKPKSAYISAALHALMSQRHVCLSAVGVRKELLLSILSDLEALAEPIVSYFMDVGGGAKEAGFVLRAKGGVVFE